MNGTIRMKTLGTILGLVLSLLFGLFCAPVPAMPPVERIVLPNELVLLAFHEPSIPIVTLELLINAGSWRDPPGMEGLANLTVKSLLLGAGKLSFRELNDRVDFLGAEISTECQKDFATIRMRVLKKDLDAGFDLFMDLVTAATFPEEEVRKQMREVAASIEAMEDQPGELAKNALEKALFVKGPYAHQEEGTIDSVGQISPELLTRFYETYYRPNNAVLSFGGDVSIEEVRTKIVPRLVNWRKAKLPDVKFVSVFQEKKTSVKIPKKLSQANIAIGSPGMARTNKDYYAFTVLNNILGSGDLTSRLMTDIRVKRGLAYAVDSVLLARKHPGLFRIDLQTKNASAREAIALAIQEVEKMQREPVSEAELDNARQYLIGSFPQRFATQQRLAAFLAQVEFFGLGLDYPDRYPAIIGSITAQDIQRVAGEYLKPDAYVLVVVGDIEQMQLDGAVPPNGAGAPQK